MRKDSVRWGILGTGGIARHFATGLGALADAELVAVGSRRRETAEAFGDDFGVPHRHTSYEALAADGDVDVVYVATPHVFHAANALLCLDAGRHVLCEKPFTINEAEARRVIDRAREKDLFVMEAMWTRFFPAIEKLRALVADGAIGEVRQVKADFCFRVDYDPQSRLFDPALGGGALLDVGVYAVSFAQMVYGREPAAARGFADFVETGVDGQAAITLGYDDGAFAALTCACRTAARHEALVIGTEGRIHVPHAFYQPDRIVLIRGDDEEAFAWDRLGNGYCYQARAFGDVLRAGGREHAVMPHADTLAVMRIMDRIRAGWGLRYPTEREGRNGRP